MKTPAAGLEQQLSLSLQLMNLMHQEYEILVQIQGLRDQIKMLGKRNAPASLKASLASLDASLEAMQGGADRRSGPAGGGLKALNGELARVFEILQGSDNAPTTQGVAATEDLQKSWDAQAQVWKQLQAEQIRPINEQLSKAMLPVLVLRTEQARIAGSNSVDKDADADVP